MPILQSTEGMTHRLPHAEFRSLATPSRGSKETALWRVSLAPGPLPPPHFLTREEIFFVIDGAARLELGGEAGIAHKGDAIVVPADVPFTIAAAGDEPVELLCCLPVGGKAYFHGAEPFVPPWAA